jgi:hypothetical protein
MFTQTFADESSLIASNLIENIGGNQSSPPQFTDSITASFYEVNKMRQKSTFMQRKNKPQVLAIRTQASPPDDQE